MHDPLLRNELLDDTMGPLIRLASGAKSRGLMRVTISEASCRFVYQAGPGHVLIVGVADG